MKACKIQIYNLENECKRLTSTIQKLLNPTIRAEDFLRVLKSTAKDLDHSVTELHNLSRDLRLHNMKETSTMLSAVKHDFAHFSKTIWSDFIQPISQKALVVTKDTIERVRMFLNQLLETIKNDIKNLLSVDRSLHAENPHSRNFMKIHVVHKKYEGKKKGEVAKKPGE
ncbi:MAG: hypothetical protein ACHP6I_03195 [Rickettsiales bacterium]